MGSEMCIRDSHQEHRDALMATVRTLGGTPPHEGLAKTLSIPQHVVDGTRSDSEWKLATIVFARDLEQNAAAAYERLLTSQLSSDAACHGVLDILSTQAMHVTVYDALLSASVLVRGKGPRLRPAHRCRYEPAPRKLPAHARRGHAFLSPP